MNFRMIWITLLIYFFILSSSPCPLAQPESQYIAQKISFDFRDSDVRNILKMIAEMGGLNIVLSEEVKGRVTIRLIEVSWDQALEVILRTQSLGMVKIGNI